MLEVSRLEAKYGDVQALWGVDLNVREREIIALVGSNGAGKSTLLRSISGLVRPSAGSVRFLGYEISGKPAQQIVKTGIAQVPEGRRLFPGLSVMDNLTMGAYLRRDKDQIQKDLDRVFAYFPQLKDRRNQLAGKLSGGEQQMCAIGRALMSSPKVLLIDEMSLGLAPVVVDTLIEVVSALRRDGMTIVLVEQDVQAALELADRGYVLEHGRVAVEGPARELLVNDHVRQAYLGL
jgi:branched-chain amino acid transport system ATP-binding protein